MAKKPLLEYSHLSKEDVREYIEGQTEKLYGNVYPYPSIFNMIEDERDCLERNAELADELGLSIGNSLAKERRLFPIDKGRLSTRREIHSLFNKLERVLEGHQVDYSIDYDIIAKFKSLLGESFQFEGRIEVEGDVREIFEVFKEFHRIMNIYFEENFSGGPLYKIDEGEKKSGREDPNYYHFTDVRAYMFLSALVAMILGIGAGYIFL